MKKKGGFTLIEILVVVVIIGILSGVAINIVNINKQKSRAQDARSYANLEKAASAIEAHYYSEGTYPASSDTGNPLDEPTNVVLNIYLTDMWPENFTYIYDVSSDAYDFAILVQKSEDENYYKYISSRSRVLECTSDTLNILTNVTSCTEVE